MVPFNKINTSKSAKIFLQAYILVSGSPVLKGVPLIQPRSQALSSKEPGNEVAVDCVWLSNTQWNILDIRWYLCLLFQLQDNLNRDLKVIFTVLTCVRYPSQCPFFIIFLRFFNSIII